MRKRYLRASMKASNGTKQEELAVHQHLLPEDADNPFRGPLNIEMKEFMPHHSLSDAVYKKVIQLLYNEGMVDELNIYASIQDLLNAVFCGAAVDTNTEMLTATRTETIGQYVYSATLSDYLLLAFKSNCTGPAVVPRLQERASKESSSDGDNEGVEESKMEASYDKSNHFQVSILWEIKDDETERQ